MQITFQSITENQQKSKIAQDILADLPMWFGIQSETEEYIKNVKSQQFIQVSADSVPVGFISIKSNNSFTAEIYVMGIKRKYHRLKTGEKLLNYITEMLRDEKYSYLLVKTLDESRESKEYEMTRLFYRKMGFVPIDVISSIWGTDNPCLLMIKKL